MRNGQNGRIWQWALGLVLLIAILVGMTLFNLNYARQNPGGSDFLVHWVGTRALVIDGISPYSDATALRIQTMAYGRPAQKGEHELRVAYPLYSIVIFLPYALIPDFATARAVWMTTLEVGLILFAYISVRLTNWKPGLFLLTLFFIFSILWYHSFRPLINGNAVVLVALGIAGAMLALRAGADELAGVLLAFTTIKPQVVVLMIVFVVFWGITQRRWRMLTWLFGTVLLLSASAALLLPDWILQEIREVIRYPGYNPPGTLAAALTTYMPAAGRRIGLMITGVLSVMLLIEWIAARNGEFRSFYWTICLTLVASQWIGIQTDPGNFIVLLPALVLVFNTWEERWRKSGMALSVASLLVLFFGIWALFLNTLVTLDGQPQQSPVMFLPLPAFLLVTLYWVRWWAVRPPGVWFDMMYSRENPRLR